MGLLAELRSPTTQYAKWITACLALILFTLLAIVTVSGFLLYRTLLVGRTGGDLQVGDLLGHPGVVSFVVPGGKVREAWFFPGLKQAPTILLCHGYESHRAEILTLVTAFQEHQFNVLVFDFSGHGNSGGYTTLGYRESRELLAALNAAAQRDDTDRTRFGVWGANLGGYAAITAAAADPRIRALAVDSIYDTPVQMLRVQVDQSGLGSFPLVRTFCVLGFKLVNFHYRHEPLLSQHLSRLAGVAKLFIEARENSALAASTHQLLLRSPEPRELWSIDRGNYAEMINEEKRDYENHVVGFFLKNLPPIRAAR